MNVRKIQELPETDRNDVEGCLWDGIAHLESACAKLAVCESIAGDQFRPHMQLVESQTKTLRALHAKLSKQVEVLGMGEAG